MFAINQDFIAFDEKNERAARKHGGAAERVSSSKKQKIAHRPSLRVTPWTLHTKAKDAHDGLSLLHTEILAFSKYVQPTPAEHELRATFIEHIRSLVRSVYPTADVCPFGSYVTKLYLPGGDVDIVVVTPHVTPFQIPAALRTLANLITKHKLGHSISIIAKARVPIIKFISSYGNFPVDISFNHTSSLKANDYVPKLISQVGGTYAVALILVVKAFLAQRGLNEVYTGGLSSYSTICLVLSYLQIHPCLQAKTWSFGSNLGIALLEIFQLYGNLFNYTQCGISVRQQAYFRKSHRGWLQPARPYLFSIEDPVDSTNDIAVGSSNALKIQQNFSGAYELLVTAVQSRDILIKNLENENDTDSSTKESSQNLSKYLLEQIDHQHLSSTPQYQTLLGSIVSFTREEYLDRESTLKSVDDDLNRLKALDLKLEKFPQLPPPTPTTATTTIQTPTTATSSTPSQAPPPDQDIFSLTKLSQEELASDSQAAGKIMRILEKAKTTILSKTQKSKISRLEKTFRKHAKRKKKKESRERKGDQQSQNDKNDDALSSSHIILNNSDSDEDEDEDDRASGGSIKTPFFVAEDDSSTAETVTKRSDYILLSDGDDHENIATKRDGEEDEESKYTSIKSISQKSNPSRRNDNVDGFIVIGDSSDDSDPEGSKKDSKIENNVTVLPCSQPNTTTPITQSQSPEKSTRAQRQKFWSSKSGLGSSELPPQSNSNSNGGQN